MKSGALITISFEPQCDSVGEGVVRSMTSGAGGFLCWDGVRGAAVKG